MADNTSIEWTGAKGWEWYEKAWSAVCYWLFRVLDAVYYALHRLTRALGQRPGIYMPLDGRMGAVWLFFAVQGYRYGDWRRRDMPAT